MSATCRWPAAGLFDWPPLRSGRTTKVVRGLLPPGLHAGKIADKSSPNSGGQTSRCSTAGHVATVADAPGPSFRRTSSLPPQELPLFRMLSSNQPQCRRYMLPPAINGGIYPGANSPLASPDEAAKAWICCQGQWQLAFTASPGSYSIKNRSDRIIQPPHG
jgi:hypothetical protein